MTPEAEPAFQDLYPDDVAHCYGCGRLNAHGLRIRSHWEGEEAVATIVPAEHHVAVPGFVYGGLVASLVDCHGVGTAAAAAVRTEGDDTQVLPRYVTGSLHVDFRRPTPMGVQLEARARVVESSSRKAVVDLTVSAGGEVSATGRVVAVRMPDTMVVAGP